MLRPISERCVRNRVVFPQSSGDGPYVLLDLSCHLSKDIKLWRWFSREITAEFNAEHTAGCDGSPLRQIVGWQLNTDARTHQARELHPCFLVFDSSIQAAICKP
jgi:hypothetical protein